MNVIFWHCHDRVTAIEGLLKALAGSGAFRGDQIAAGGVKERVEVDHVAGHVARPLEDLRAYVDEERVRGPSAEDRNFRRGVVHEKESHGSARSYGSISDLVGVESEHSEASIEVASVAEEFANK
jgi:hypothetical protein